ncbi:MAG TPA: lysylphosphatidylglycerol synthase transmembrane domain-containing protein [Bryobacteraceae bacterium]|nr:lysylphosphatidylglycerol synthase transmembrane domain-containing protein [Bryobacteraceae bacterium]
MREAPSRDRSKLLPFAVAALCLIFVWLALRHYSSFDWGRFAQTFKILRPGWFLLGFALSTASFLGRGVRWQVMMLPARSSFWRVAFATYVGFSAVVMFGRAGELVRPYLIARNEKTQLAAQAGFWVLERFYDFFAVLLLFGIGIIRARQLGIGVSPRMELVLHIGGWIAIGSALLAGIVFYLMAHKPGFCRQRLNDAASLLPAEHHARFLRSLDSFLSAVRPASQWPNLLKSLALTAAVWAMILGAVWSYFHAFPPASSFSTLDIATYLGFTAFGAILQLPGIGGGMQIASVVILTELFRMPVEQAIGFSLFVWAGTTIVVLPFGVPLALDAGLTLRKLRGMGREASL